MKDDYPLKGATVELTVKLEKEVAEILGKMAEFSKLGQSEIVNTSVKRFISTHSDLLPKKK